MAYLIRRLEQGLSLWELCCFMNSCIERWRAGVGEPTVLPVKGPLRHWREFRPALLRSYTRGGEMLDVERFMSDIEIQNELDTRCLAWLPVSLFAWTSASRRVFNVDAELQAVFASTSVEELRWSDVPWPFSSFAIEVEKPIPSATGKMIDLFLVSYLEIPTNEGSRLTLLIHMMPNTLDDFRPVSRIEIDQIEELVRRRRWGTLATRYNQLVDRLAEHALAMVVIPMESFQRQTVLETFEEFRRQDARFPISVFQHVVGLAMHLDAFPSSSSTRSVVRQGAAQTPDRHAITRQVDICLVRHEQRLAREQIEKWTDFVHPPREMSAHWVRAHRRRAPGFGSDPHAPRQVRVKPYRVCVDRLPLNAIPGGTRTKL